MSDLIDRQEAINAVKKVDMQVYEGNAAVGRRLYLTQDEMIAIIESLPSVESEQKTGKWVYDGIRGRFPACKCSICGHYENADWALLQGVNYCPNCGADMRGDDE